MARPQREIRELQQGCLNDSPSCCPPASCNAMGRFKGGRDGTLWFYRALTDAFWAAEPSPLVAELERTVTELERLVAEHP